MARVQAILETLTLDISLTQHDLDSVNRVRFQVSNVPLKTERL